MTADYMFILQAAIGAGILILIINIAIIIAGLSTLTVFFTKKFEREKAGCKQGLTTFDSFLIVVKAFVYAILITTGLLVAINFILYLTIDLTIS